MQQNQSLELAKEEAEAVAFRAEKERKEASAQMDETGGTMKRLMAHSSGLDAELEMMAMERKVQESEIEVTDTQRSFLR